MNLVAADVKRGSFQMGKKSPETPWPAGDSRMWPLPPGCGGWSSNGPVSSYRPVQGQVQRVQGAPDRLGAGGGGASEPRLPDVVPCIRMPLMIRISRLNRRP